MKFIALCIATILALAGAVCTETAAMSAITKDCADQSSTDKAAVCAKLKSSGCQSAIKTLDAGNADCKALTASFKTSIKNCDSSAAGMNEAAMPVLACATAAGLLF